MFLNIKNKILSLKMNYKVILVILMLGGLEFNFFIPVLADPIPLLEYNFSVDHDQTQSLIDNKTPTITETIPDNLETEPYAFHQLVTLGLIKGYQLFISPSKVIDCPMYPSCSRFGYQAFQSENPLTAFVLTADRLHRCAHDINNYEVVKVGENYRLYDPPGYFPTLKGVGERDAFVNVEKILLQPEVKNNNDSMSKDEQQYQFAKSIELSGDYGRAIVEYRRLLFYYPNSHYKSQALQDILDCYYKGKKYDEAIRWGIFILDNGLKEVDKNNVRFKIACCYFRMKNNISARDSFNQVIVNENAILKEKSIMLLGLTYAYEIKWNEAEREFVKIKSDSKYINYAQKCMELCQQGKRLKYKNPKLAAFLGIIPGLGYLYDGYSQTALSSLVVNGLFMNWTVKAYQNGDHAQGNTVGLFSLGWYSGNIYGSYVSAERRNLKIISELLEKFDLGFDF